MNYLKKSTGVTIILGPFIHQLPDSGTTGTFLDNVTLAGVSPGLVKSNSAVSVSLGGRQFAVVGGCSGYYQLGLTSTDTAVTGPLKVFISGASGGSNSFLDVNADFEVVSSNYYNFMHGDGYLSGVTVHAFGSTAISDAGVTVVYHGSGVTTRWLGATAVSDSGVTVENFSNTATAAINTQVLDVLNVDTFGEPAQGAPSATTSVVGKLGYIYKFTRNQVTNDGTYIKVFADDATTVDHKATVAESGGTVTRGEFITGA